MVSFGIFVVGLPFGVFQTIIFLPCTLRGRLEIMSLTPPFSNTFDIFLIKKISIHSTSPPHPLNIWHNLWITPIEGFANGFKFSGIKITSSRSSIILHKILVHRTRSHPSPLLKKLTISIKTYPEILISILLVFFTQLKSQPVPSNSTQ